MRKNFWPRVRDYRSAHDLLGLRRRLLDETCNVRIHGTTGERPLDRLPTGHVNASPLMRLHIDKGVDCVLGFGADLAFAGSQLDLAKRVEVGRGAQRSHPKNARSPYQSRSLTAKKTANSPDSGAHVRTTLERATARSNCRGPGRLWMPDPRLQNRGEWGRHRGSSYMCVAACIGQAIDGRPRQAPIRRGG